MKKVILAYNSLYPKGLEDLSSDFDIVKLWRESDPASAIAKNRERVAAIIALPGAAIDRLLIESLPNLEIISNFSVGTDHVDLKAAADRNVAVTNTPDVLTADTADTALSLLLGVSRLVTVGDRYVRDGKWGQESFPLGYALAGKKCGIVGLGRIGKAITRRVTAFDMEVCYFGRTEKSDVPYSYYSDLNEMVKRCDYIILSCSGGPETKHLVNAELLNVMKPDAFLINVARGSVVDEDALIAALENKKLAGAGLDVYENEPDVPDALKKMENVVLLPHIGSATHETRIVMAQLVIDNIKAHFDGRALKTPVAA